MFSHNFNTFQKARIALTLWYILITALLLVIFSIAAIGAEKRAFGRIEQALANKAQRPKLTALLEKRILEFEKNFRNRLLLFDLALFLIASGSSYLLSGRTLKPIQEMIKQQEEFSADASHELRTPLTTIDMEIEALKRTERNLPEKYKNIFISIQEEISRMRNIVDGLLILVRSNYANTKKSWKIFNLSELITDTFKQMQPLAHEKSLDFKLENKQNLMVYGSTNELKQVVIILLDNAIKYTPLKESVTVKTFLKENNVNLVVQDTGVGITEKDLPHIFNRFYRASNSQDQYRGVGIGLAIAKKIIENHQGKILVESTLHQGSKFTIHLPYYS